MSFDNPTADFFCRCSYDKFSGIINIGSLQTLNYTFKLGNEKFTNHTAEEVRWRCFHSFLLFVVFETALESSKECSGVPLILATNKNDNEISQSKKKSNFQNILSLFSNGVHQTTQAHTTPDPISSFISNIPSSFRSGQHPCHPL